MRGHVSQRRFWLPMGACYGALIGHVLATLLATLRLRPDDRPYLLLGLTIGGTMIGLIMVVAAEASHRDDSTQYPPPPPIQPGTLSWHRCLWALLPVLMCLYLALLPAFRVARE